MPPVTELAEFHDARERWADPMTLSADEIIDRRRMRRRVAFWRVAAFLALAAFVAAVGAASGAFEMLSKRGSNHIARVTIEGFISNDRDLIKLIGDLAKNDRVKAVILDISSPGGSTVGGEAIYETVRELAAAKPVVASVGTLAASAAYMIACGTDQIVSRRSSIVGSIGVLFQYGDVSTLLEKVGVRVDAIKSSPLKAEPSPFRPASEEAKQMIGKVIDDSYAWFVDVVAERRKFDRAKALQLADGSIFTGSQGLANGLVDRIGGEEVANKWLVEERKISPALKIIEWKPAREGNGLFSNPAGVSAMARLFGAEEAYLVPGIREFLERSLFLDGLMSVMHSDGLHNEGSR
jgi:protease-4